MIAVEPGIFRNIVTVGGQEPGIATGIQVLQRVGGEAPGVAKSAAWFAVIERADGLRRIFDNRKPVPLGNVPDRPHIGDPSGQMHRHDRLGFRRDFFLDFRRIDILIGQHIGEDRRGPDMGYHCRRRNE